MDDYGYILEVDLGKLHSLSLLHSSAHTNHIFNNFKFNQSIIISNLATTNIILICCKYFFFQIGYPEDLHNWHNEYPLAPEKMSVNPSMLSPAQKEVYEKTYGDPSKIKPSLPKLIPNLQDKTKYIIHYQNLKLYLSLGKF